jgi:hypothetical protein
MNSSLHQNRPASEHKPHSPIQAQREHPQTQRIRFRE